MPEAFIKMYYVLLNELEKPRFDAYIEGPLMNAGGKVQPNIFGHGESVKQIADTHYTVRVNDTFSKPGKLRDRLSVFTHNSVHLLVVSEKVQQLLNQYAADQIELYPFELEYGESTLSTYKIVNVLNKIDCLDSERSDVDFEDYDDNDTGIGHIYTINKLVLDTSQIPQSLLIFLLGRSIEPVIIFHETLKNKIETLNLSGFVFALPEEFQL